MHDTHAVFANLGTSKKMTDLNIQHKETDDRNSTPDDVVLGYPMITCFSFHLVRLPQNLLLRCSNPREIQ